MPSDYFTMCRGEAQLLLDLLMIPCFSSYANSFLVASNLSLSNHCMRCKGLGSTLDLLSTLGNSSNMCCHCGK